MQNIPKIIHCCWFGEGEKNKTIERCMETWGRFMPQYKIIEWNEANFDISTAPIYVQEAYERKKYAFVSDYVRLYALEKYGGVYFDTDIEVCKNFDDKLENRNAVVGFQDDAHLMTGFMACIPQFDVIKRFVKYYDDLCFVLPDGSLNVTANPTMFTKLFAEMKGLTINGKTQFIDGHVVAYSREYFSAFDLNNDHEISTDETCTIHHYTGTWNEATLRKKKIKRLLVKILGPKKYVAFKAFIKKLSARM